MLFAEYISQSREHDYSPKSGEKMERLLPEDSFIRGQLFALNYLYTGWYKDNMIDEEERKSELPSITVIRVERLLWLGVRIAKVYLVSFYGRGLLTLFGQMDK